MTIIYAVALLGVLIFVHELGHFLFAKLLGVKVEKFSIGFGPVLLGKKIGETEYLLSAIPLGGYVKMLGENPAEVKDASDVSDSDVSDSDDEDEEEVVVLTEEEKKRAFGFQPLWKKFVIVFMGPFFNLAFAAFIFFLVFTQGMPAMYAEVGEVMDGSPAAQASLKANDRIVGIDEVQVKSWSEMTAIIFESPDKEILLSVKRGDSIIEVPITPRGNTVKDLFGEDRHVGQIGIKASGNTFTRELSIPEAAVLGVKRTVEISYFTLKAVVKLVQRVIPADQVGGPILIFQMAEKTAEQGIMSFLTFMAVISINLGIINLFPIPILDGGHIMFFTIEAIRRKPISDTILMNAQKVGLALLLMLMVFAFYNDVIRIVSGTELP